MAWARTHGFHCEKLTANRSVEIGTQAVSLQLSSYGPQYYLNYGIALAPVAGFVHAEAGACDIWLRLGTTFPNGVVIDLEKQEYDPSAVSDLLDREVAAVLERTSTIEALERFKCEGGLDAAAIVLPARIALGWSPD